MLPLAAGGFIYIAGSDLVPELNKEVDPWQISRADSRHRRGCWIDVRISYAGRLEEIDFDYGDRTICNKLAQRKGFRVDGGVVIVRVVVGGTSCRRPCGSRVGNHPRDAEKRLARRHRAQLSRARGDDADQLLGRLQRSSYRFSRHGPRVGAYDVSRQPGAVIRAAFQPDGGHGRQFQCQHPTNRHAIFFHRAKRRSRNRAAHRGGAHARRARHRRAVAPRARRHRAGGGAGLFQPAVFILLALARANVCRHAL